MDKDRLPSEDNLATVSTNETVIASPDHKHEKVNLSGDLNTNEKEEEEIKGKEDDELEINLDETK